MRRVRAILSSAAVGVLVQLLLVSIPSPLPAQEIDLVTKLKLAQSFEQAGEWERVVPLYEELYRLDPSNYVYFDGLRRAYAQLKQYTKAIGIVQQRLSLRQKDPVLWAVLGGLFYDSGDEQKADSVWKAVPLIDPSNNGLYRVVASEMLQRRMYEQAIRTYILGRSTSKNESIFADDLAMLYSAMQQYGSATGELVRLVKASPQQLPFVQSRIASFTIRDEGLRAAATVVSDEVMRNPQNASLHALLAWLYMEGRNYPPALREYEVIDKLNKANGAEMFNFAQRLLQERVYTVAEVAFRRVVEEYPNTALLPHARFGYARAVEELSVVSDTVQPGVAKTIQEFGNEGDQPVSESLPSYQRAIRLYEAMIKDYPNSDLSTQSLFRIGLIRYERFFDLDGALNAFERVKKAPQNPSLVLEATLKAGDVQVARSDLGKARREYLHLSVIPIVESQNQGLFKLSELDYYESQFDSALAKLGRFTSNLQTDLTNDALLLQYFILENKTSALKALSEFSKADLLMRQRKYSEALLQFKEIRRVYPNALLVDDAEMRIAELHLVLHQTGEALATFRFVADSMQTSILKDQAQMRIAEVYQYIVKDKTRALEVYEQLLAKYPYSLYVEEARKRIRLLRGDAI